MRDRNLSRRSIIGVTAILIAALVGLVFVNTDYVAADKAIPQVTQPSLESSAGATEGKLGDSISVMPSLIRIISALIIVIVCIYGGIFLLKRLMGRRYQGNRKISNLEVLETIHIAQGKSVSLLRIGDKSVLVGSTENNISLLSRQDAAETAKLLEAAEVELNNKSFSEMMRSAVARVKEVTERGRKIALESRFTK